MIVNNYSSQSPLSALLKTAQNAPTQKNKPDQNNPLLDAIAKDDPDRAAALKAEQAQLKETMAKLEAANTDQREERKAAAREKIERIKAQLQALRLAAGGDPKTIAKLAARLAHELAAAAKEYAAAGGGAIAGVGIPASNAAPQPPAASPAIDAETGDQPAMPSSPPQQTAGGTETDESRRRMAAGQEDIDFVRKVRELKDELENILSRQKDRLRRQGDAGRNDDIDRAEKHLRDTAGSLNGIATGMPPAAVHIDISV